MPPLPVSRAGQAWSDTFTSYFITFDIRDRRTVTSAKVAWARCSDLFGFDRKILGSVDISILQG